MKSISKLKDEARKYEQREEWEKAIQAYLQVLKVAAEAEAEVELPLYNRLGDLCVRMGKPQDAVRHYEQAADRYAEAGLYNNAIALCNKALRYNPDRPELIRKLGQFSASQGFITDARRYFLDYAERQFRAGKVSDALNALEDFANVSDDAEIRELLGRQLAAHGRINDAVDELKKAYAMRVRAGEAEQAAKIRESILAIDPRAQIEGSQPPPPPQPTPASPRDALTSLPGFVEVERREPKLGGPAPTPPAAAPPAAPPPDTVSINLAGLESRPEPPLEIDLPPASGIEGLETTTLDFNEVEHGSTLSDLGIEPDQSLLGETGGRDAETFELPEPDTPRIVELPAFQEAGSAFELPLLEEPEERRAPDPEPMAAAAPEPPAEPEPDPEPEYDILPPEPLPDLSGFAGLGGDLRAEFSLPAAPENTDIDVPSIKDASSINDASSISDTASINDVPPIDDAPSTDLPLIDVPEEPASWDDTTRFEVPAADEPDLGLETWEPETPPFELPEPEEPAPPVVESSAGPTEVVDVPAIELPTWDTEPIVETDPPGQDETVWIEGSLDQPDDIAPELPTFSPDDESAGTAEVAIEDDDPLDLAAHLKGYEREPAPSADVIVPPEPVAEPVILEVESAGDIQAGEAAPDELVVEPADAWLDEIADDDTAPWAQTMEAAPRTSGAAPPAARVVDTRAIETPAGPAAEETTPSPAPAANGASDDFIDLGSLLSDGLQQGTRFRVREVSPTGDEDRDFAELLNQFKLKVQEHLPPEDAAAHYDLGLAFKEMGLLDEAIGEFQIALRAGHMRMKVYEELGQCFLQKEEYNIAEKVLSRALGLKYDDELELLGVYYHLGRAYEALGRPDQARDAYERVLGMDINFEDVTDRLAQLQRTGL